MLSCTLNEICAASPYENSWRKLLGHLGKSKADETIVTLETVLDSNGLFDALWVLDNVIKNKRIFLLFAADCAEQVLPIFERERPEDDRPRMAIAVARNPDATDEDRAAARSTLAAAWATGAAGEGPAAQSDRLRQYISHGEAAADMPWPDMEESE